MSTYYSFYMFLKKKDDSKQLIYCGPYNKKGKIAPIYGISGSFTYGLLDSTWDINEDYFDEYGLSEYFKKFGDFFKNHVKLLDIEDLHSIKDDMDIQCYVRRDIIRNIEFNPQFKEEFDPLIYNLEYEDDSNEPGVISPLEYNNLTLENKQNYIFYPYKNYESAARHKNDILTIAYNWFNENIDYVKEFEGYTTNELVFVVSY